MKKETFKKIYKSIKEHDVIVIARHIGPDPDAIASQIGLRESIRLTFPNKKVYAVGLGVSRFKYFGNLDKIDDSLLNNPLLIILDVPNKARIDGVSLDKYQDIIKIDHHPFEEAIGKIEYVDVSASSTCELIMQLISCTSLKINKEIAENLYMGIIADSDRFLFETTTATTFNIAADIIKKYKINLKDLYNKLYERPLNEVRFQSFITLNMTVTENGLGYIKLTSEMIKEYNVDVSSASNMVNNFNYIKEIISWVFVTYDEKQELYKVNIRSRGPVINEIASKYNGGGHKYASGARITEEKLIDELLRDLDEACKSYKEELNSEKEACN